MICKEGEYKMNEQIKKYADSGDVKSLNYIVVDALDVDPTFVGFEEEYNYCKSVPGLLEPYVELTPFKVNQDDWDEDYWTSLKIDLVKNFSDRRMSHMREVAKVFLADKVQQILAERASNASVKKTSEIKNSFPSSTAETKTSSVSSKATEPIRRATVSKAAEQARKLEEEKRKLEVENKVRAEREAKEKAARIAQQGGEQEQATAQSGGVFPKAMGIAVAAAAVAVVAVAVVVILK